MTYLYFKSKAHTLHAFKACTTTWCGVPLIATADDIEHGGMMGVTPAGSAISTRGDLRKPVGYYELIDKPTPSPSSTPKTEGGPEGFTGERKIFIDPHGTLHEHEGYRGSRKGVKLVATYYGFGRAYFVGEDGSVFEGDERIYDPEHLSPLPEAPPPRDPPRILDMLIPKLVAVQPTFLRRPDQEAVLKKLLIRAVNRKMKLSDLVEDELGTPGHEGRTHHVLDAADTLSDIVEGIENLDPPEWADDWQAITEQRLEIDRMAGTGDILEGGYVLYRMIDGTHLLEHTDGVVGEGSLQPWSVVEVHQRTVPDHVYEELDWAREKDTPDERLRAGVDADPKVRAAEVAAIGDHYGWANIDDYPIRLSGKEALARFEKEDWDARIAGNAEDLQPTEDYNVDNVTGLLFDILTYCEHKKQDFDERVAHARALRRNTVEADPWGAPASWQASRLADLLNAKPDILVHGPELSIVVRLGPNDTERLVYDDEAKTWKVKPWELPPVR